MTIARVAILSVVAGLAGYSGPANAESVLLRCDKFQDSSTGAPVMFVKVDVAKSDFAIRSYSDDGWKGFKEAKFTDDVVQIQEKRWVDRSTGVLRWDFATYQCQTTRPKLF